MSSLYGAWGRKAERHGSPEIQWSLCDECPSLRVRDLTGTKVYQLHGGAMYEYECDSLHRRLTRKEIYEMDRRTCPLGRDPYEHRRFK